MCCFCCYHWEGSVAFTFVLPTLRRIAYRSTCRKAYGPWEDGFGDPFFVVLGSWLFMDEMNFDECLADSPTFDMFLVFTKRNLGMMAYCFFVIVWLHLMTRRKKGKVGIVNCIPRYAYMVEFESASAFLGPVFQDNIRPTSANRTHSQLRNVHHWVILKARRFNKLWHPLSVYSLYQQIVYNSSTKILGPFVLST